MKHRILCVEDDEIDQLTFRRRLNRLEIEKGLIFVESIQEAIHATRTYCPDLVFLDWHLSDGDGSQYLDYVSEHHPTLPVIVLTGGAEDLARNTFHNGAQDFLLKGQFSDRQLERAVTHAILRTRALHHKKLERCAAELKPIQRYATHFVNDVQKPTDRLQRQLTMLVELSRTSHSLALDPIEFKHAVAAMLRELQEILAVTHKLAKRAHGGDFDSPRETENLLDTPCEEHTTPSARFDVGKRLTILLIDNEHYTRLMFQRLLEQNHDLTFVDTLAEATARLSAEPTLFDGVLCNIVLPRSALELLEQTLAHLPTEALRRLVLTSTTPDPCFLDLIAKEGISLLPKPFSHAQLHSILIHWSTLYVGSD